jgi:hypothetical protein
VLRSVVQVRRGEKGSEYVFRSAIQFSPIPPEQEPSLHEFLNLQIEKLREKQRQAAAGSRMHRQECLCHTRRPV